ncbi:protein IMPAIRED IN BABA-INDUCED STERILITY 1-like isoform X2 [Phoenix dactylifera]|uniref:[RNA-polymerase]-subunit kinase n=1 Tax=Phoenix dactylifera TaxID=42345 RepID=A0A8B7C248_PHODC|nr:protein IMPAIRED IN BABA-INDUCED STERILITY 1-like isoform X2 [Phoenix dactylifera]
MGCVASKKAVSVTPAVDSSGVLRYHRQGSGAASASSSRRHRAGEARSEKEEERDRREPGDSGKVSVKSTSLRSFRLGSLANSLQGEQVAAGWPAWLSAVAGEAIQGWVPLKADSFEKLEKIGQGTYSSVFRARDLDTGKIVALKKVRFDNFEPESVRFMAREILILRRLDHPNVVKLEGLITSRMSCSLYLVFEYMDHDLAGLCSSPEIKLSEPQIKCYMHQLLSGLEHCHLRGVIHRDIKGANLLVNNEGVLKIADFGLANFCRPGHKQPLTSRVVTLWYRPPELLLGSTDYEATVDLWSVGCVFAELFLRKPILQGRTEVEQLHKIFKLCGSPEDEYWKKSKLPHPTIFKPHHPYESCLPEAFKDLPASAVGLLDVFLSVEPCRRGTASTALASVYFRTMPYACDPSSLPTYPPNKEIDAKSREELCRRRVVSRGRGVEATRRPTRAQRPPQEPSMLSKVADQPEINTHGVNKNDVKQDLNRVNGEIRLFADLQPVPAINPPKEGRHVKNYSQEDYSFTGPLHVSVSSAFAWARNQKEGCAQVRSHSRSNSRSHLSGAMDPSCNLRTENAHDLKGQANGNGYEAHADSKGHEPRALAKQANLKKWTQLERPDSFDSSDMFHSQDLSEAVYMRDGASSKYSNLGYQDQVDRIEFSGPLLSQSHKVDELLEKHERHIRRVVRKSWFLRGKKPRK